MKSQRSVPEDRHGRFPFSFDPEHRVYIERLRSYANYMGVMGFADYVRAAAVLMRGMTLNFLVFTPYMLVAGLVVTGLSIRPPHQHFLLTRIVLIAGVAWTLLFALATPVFRFVRHRQAMETGSYGTVEARDRFERTFAYFVLMFVAAIGAETLAYALPAIDARVFESGIGWPQLASVGAVSLALLSGIDKILSSLAGLVRTLALLALGALGVGAPIVAVLFVASFVVFRPPPGDFEIVLRLGTWIVGVGILLALALYWRRAAIAERVGGLVLAALVFALGSIVQASWSTLYERSEEADQVAAVVGVVRTLPDSLRRQLAREAGPRAGAILVMLARLQDDIRPVLEARYSPILTAPGAERDPSVAELQAGRLTAESLGSIALWLAPSEVAPVQAVIDEHWDARIGGTSSFLRRTPPRPDLDVLRRSLALDAAYGRTRYPTLYETLSAATVRDRAFRWKVMLVAATALIFWLFAWWTVDINLTSVHGLYRDRLATAFLVRPNYWDGEIEPERDVDLTELCQHQAGSTAPYHLINTTLNLQGSDSVEARNRKGDFFIFSKRFIGGARTGYCRSESMQRIFPQMDLATAMAVSAAAASPNMGRATNPALVALLTILNIRLGYWIPNPSFLDPLPNDIDPHRRRNVGGIGFPTVFDAELNEVEGRWRAQARGTRQLHGGDATPGDDGDRIHPLRAPTTKHGLVGLAFSGGGIRSATLNLGITQVLHQRGVFDHVDYLSTVSGGGYLGSSISTAMRQSSPVRARYPGVVSIRKAGGHQVVSVADDHAGHVYRFSVDARLAVAEGDQVTAGTPLIVERDDPRPAPSARKVFNWRVRNTALLREIQSRLDERYPWVNVSDGGHVENLGAIELLRRRCALIIVGDSEADPHRHFEGMATLLRTARIELHCDIDIDLSDIRPDEKGHSRRQWAIGTIRYDPDSEEETGLLLYLKSAVTGREDEVIRNYRNKHPAFPHESTADQFFDEAQFEAYRSLGQHIGEEVLAAGGSEAGKVMNYAQLRRWFEALEGPDQEREIRAD